MSFYRLCMFVVFAVMLIASAAHAQKLKDISMAYVSMEIDRAPVLSNLIEAPDDLGRQGAKLALEDNATTGRFTGHRFHMTFHVVTEEADVVSHVLALVEKGVKIFLLDLPAPALKSLLKAIGDSDLLFFNTRARDNELRETACDVRLLHTMPSRSMLTDALAQYLVRKRWSKWFLIQGQMPQDARFARALEKSARKFGAQIVHQKTWDGARDARRTAQAEIPLLTQGAAYDVMLVADERGDFGEFLMYRTFDPRPVAGTQGLFPTAWFWTVEQWGAQQLQNRFVRQAGRPMEARDFAAWAAVRTIGEAATRTASDGFEELNRYIRSDAFELAAFKGRKLSYRRWNGQLRQPVVLTSARSLVAQAPLAGFLHHRTELDTLGVDEGETKCKEFVR